MIIKNKLLLIILIAVGFSGCKDNENKILQDSLPFPDPFNLVLNLDLPAYQSIAFENHLYLPDYGLSGLVIVKLESNRYAVYDRICPVNPEEDCSIVDFVNLGTSGSFLQCQCGEAFYRADTGLPSNSPEPRKLREYFSESSNNTLLIDSSIR